jgi:hypothetical protein
VICLHFERVCETLYTLHSFQLCHSLHHIFYGSRKSNLFLPLTLCCDTTTLCWPELTAVLRHNHRHNNSFAPSTSQPSIPPQNDI